MKKGIVAADKREDGGWGWAIVGGTFFALFIRVSTVKVLAVLLPSIRDDLEIDTSVIGWVISAMLTLSDFTALPAAWMCTRCGHRLVVMTGGLLVSVGLIFCSLSMGVWSLLSPLVLAGVGMGLVENPTISMVTVYFNERYATATSLALTSIPIGIMVAPLMTQFLLDTYGWRGALLMWGGISLHMSVCGALLRPVATVDSADGDIVVSPVTDGSCKARWKQFVRASHMYLLKDFSFFTILCILCCERLCFMAWMIYLVPHAIQEGLTPYQAASLPLGAGFANFFGKVIQGLFVDSKLVTSNSLLCATAFVAGLCLMLDPLAGTFAGRFVLGVVYGLAVGTLFPLGVTVLKDLVGESRFILALGWCTFIMGMLRMPMGFIPGLLYDVSGSYDASFISLGAVEMLPVPLLIIDLIRRRSRWFQSRRDARRDDYEMLLGDSVGSSSLGEQ
ncbi:monocarboxylate transporter 13-like [Asterias amurensis]|uniref:monocarboxylate transporter 13-like n=1 Tax=Asterias amurensis TaxID=7602 RepID=UPI003AB8B1F3